MCKKKMWIKRSFESIKLSEFNDPKTRYRTSPTKLHSNISCKNKNDEETVRKSDFTKNASIIWNVLSDGNVDFI